MSAKSKQITLTELVKITGFARSRLRYYAKRGMPHKKAKNPRGGHPLYKFTLADVLTWLAGRGIVVPSAQSEASAAVVNPAGKPRKPETRPQPSAPAASPVPANKRLELDQDALNRPGLLGALERLRLQEFNVMAVMGRKVRAGAPADEIAALERVHTRLINNLRLAEKSALEYRRIEGELVDFEAMCGAWVRVAIGITTAIDGIPAGAVPRLKPLLADPEGGMEAVYDILATECERAKLSIPNEVPGRSDRQGPDGDQAASAAEG